MAIVNPESEGATKSAPRTAPKEERRLQLIQATIESIGKHGISGTTMKTVTGIAGLSMGIVNFHFDNKDTLFQETLRFLGEEHRDQWRKGIKSSSLRPEEKLLRIVDSPCLLVKTSTQMESSWCFSISLSVASILL